MPQHSLDSLLGKEGVGIWDSVLADHPFPEIKIPSLEKLQASSSSPRKNRRKSNSSRTTTDG